MITQKEIAEHLGIAPRTVANILSGSPVYRYREETRQLVLDTAEKMGYRPNRASQTVRRKRSNLIGIVHFASIAEVTRKTNAVLPQLVNAAGYDYMAIDLNWHGGNVERVLDELMQVRVEGILISFMMESFGPRYTELLAKFGIPAVAVYGDSKLNIPIAADDARSAFYAMTRHLQSVGHRRILLLASHYDARPSRQRIEGFRLAMQDHSPSEIYEDAPFFSKYRKCLPWQGESAGIALKVDLSHADYHPTLGHYRIVKQLLQMDNPPDAIICPNDLAAFGAYTAAFEMGLRVPDDLAITGADNDLFGEFPLYGLTTIEKDIDATCGAAIDMLVAKIEKKKIADERPSFSSNLILRKSCGRIITPGQPDFEIFPAPTIHSFQTAETYSLL